MASHDLSAWPGAADRAAGGAADGAASIGRAANAGESTDRPVRPGLG